MRSSSTVPQFLAILVAGTVLARAQCTLDAEQDTYDGGTSARTLPGYVVWQSFTPGTDGSLCRVEVGFFNDMAGEARLDVLEGEGTGGPVLFTRTVPVIAFSLPGPSWNAWDVDVAVLAGHRYTFTLTPDAATLPDPYGACVGVSDPYPGGVMGLDDPSGSWTTPFDLVFRTHVAPPSGPSVYRHDAPEDVADPSHLLQASASSPYDDASAGADPLLFYVVDDGSGEPAEIRARRVGDRGVRLSWP